MTDIQLGADSFLKTAKRLQKNLNNHTLSQTQELLAQALGFRNLHALHKKFTETSDITADITPKAVHKDKNFLSILSERKLAVLLSTYLEPDMWGNRAQQFIDALLPGLYYLQKQGEFTITPQSLKTALSFKEAIILSKRDTPSRALLKNYLQNLPGYNESNNKAEELHGYNITPISKILNILSVVDDTVIIPKHSIDLIKEGKFVSPSSDVYGSYLHVLLQEMVVEQGDKVGITLTLQDVVALSLNYIDTDKRKKIFRLVEDFCRNMELTKEYSLSLQKIQ